MGVEWAEVQPNAPVLFQEFLAYFFTFFHINRKARSPARFAVLAAKSGEEAPKEEVNNVTPQASRRLQLDRFLDFMTTYLLTKTVISLFFSVL